MGGWGSGPRRPGGTKWAAERCHALDTAALRRWGLLAPGTRSGSVHWGDGEALDRRLHPGGRPRRGHPAPDLPGRRDGGAAHLPGPAGDDPVPLRRVPVVVRLPALNGRGGVRPAGPQAVPGRAVLRVPAVPGADVREHPGERRPGVRRRPRRARPAGGRPPAECPAARVRPQGAPVRGAAAGAARRPPPGRDRPDDHPGEAGRARGGVGRRPRPRRAIRAGDRADAPFRPPNPHPRVGTPPPAPLPPPPDHAAEARRCRADAARVVGQLALIAFADITDVFDPSGRPLPLADVPPHVRRGAGQVHGPEEAVPDPLPRRGGGDPDGGGGRGAAGPKIPALAALARYLGRPARPVVTGWAYR